MSALSRKQSFCQEKRPPFSESGLGDLARLDRFSCAGQCPQALGCPRRAQSE